MQSIQAGTTATFPPDFASPDTLGQKWVVVQENPDGSDGPLVAIAGGGNNGGWNVQAVDSPDLTVTVPLGAAPNVIYRIVCAAVAGGSLTGSDYNAKILVTPAPIPVPTLTATPTLIAGVPAIILSGN